MGTKTHWGKIACHFPSRGNPNADTYGIKFLKKNGGSNDLVDIDRVYMIPPGVTVQSATDLEKYIVWTTDISLEETNDAVTIEYVPVEDINLSNLAIFTESSESSTSVNVAIFHESGLVVAKVSGDTISSETMFGKNGYRRLAAVSGVTLKKGYKYYIQYTNSNASFKPEAISGWHGNYLKWTHGQAQSKSIANINDTNGYYGETDNIDTFITTTAGVFRRWTGSFRSLSSGTIYIRNSLATGPYIGAVGTAGSNLDVTAKDKILSTGANKVFRYVGWNYNEGGQNVLEEDHIYTRKASLDPLQYGGIKNTVKGLLDDLALYDYAIYTGNNIGSSLVQNRIYQKIASIYVAEEIDFSDYNNNLTALIELINKSYVAGGTNKAVGATGNFYYKDRSGDVFTLKSGYTVDFGPNNAGYDHTFTNWQTNCIYYLNENSSSYTDGYHDVSVCVYNGSSLIQIGTASTSSEELLSTYFDIVSLVSAVAEVPLEDAVNRIGTASDLASAAYDNTYQSDGVRSATLYTDQKFYLELNGMEV